MTIEKRKRIMMALIILAVISLIISIIVTTVLESSGYIASNKKDIADAVSSKKDNVRAYGGGKSNTIFKIVGYIVPILIIGIYATNFYQLKKENKYKINKMWMFVFPLVLVILGLLLGTWINYDYSKFLSLENAKDDFVASKSSGAFAPLPWDSTTEAVLKDLRITAILKIITTAISVTIIGLISSQIWAIRKSRKETLGTVEKT